MLSDEIRALYAEINHEDLPQALDILRERAGDDAFDEAIRDAKNKVADSKEGGVGSGDWQPVVPIGEYELPTFPTSVLPPWLARFVESVAEATQTPPDLAATLSLAAVAACVQKKAMVCARSGWTEPLNLYTVCVLGPGNRKSAVCHAVLKPIETFEKEERERLLPEMSEKQAALRVLQARLRESEARAGRYKGDEEDLETLGFRPGL